MVRFKHRYALLELIPHDNLLVLPFTSGQLYSAVKKAIELMHGDYGIGSTKSSLQVKYLSSTTRIVLVRVARGAHHMVLSAISMITKVGTVPMTWRTLHIHGSIRSCQKYLVMYNQRQLSLLLKECTTEEERLDVQQAIVNSSNSLQTLHTKPGRHKPSVTASRAQNTVDEDYSD